MATAPIPFTDIYNFATIIGVEDKHEFHYLMRQMDEAYLEHNQGSTPSDDSSTNDNNQG